MSKPFLCECGNLLNVDEIAPGNRFGCPSCGAEKTLDLSDPGLLTSFTDAEGVFGLLLKQRLTDIQTLDMALPVEGADPKLTETRTTPLLSPLASPVGLNDGDSLGPFRIEQIIGRGGMGTVYEAFDTSLQRTVALKVLAEEHSRNTEVVDRFQREARAAGSLTHPNITHIYSIGEERGYHYFAMELIRGRTLSQVQEQDHRIAEDDAVDYLLQVARGLRAAKRKKIIHRDLKPSNLILSEHGLVKITDFGLAKLVTNPIDITATGVIVGTPLYMSPEQGKGEPLDHRSDIYSLGCSFYHLVSGRPPFHGETAMSIIVRHITETPPPLASCAPNVGTHLCRVIDQMMSKDPEQRFQNYTELVEHLSAATGSSSSVTRLEAKPGRVVLSSHTDAEAVPADAMSVKQLSVADVNLELGRYQKALSLYKMVLEQNPHLEVELAFRMVRIYQQRGDHEEAQRLYSRIGELSEHPAERFFCHWKLVTERLENSLQSLRSTRDSLASLLEQPLPEGVEEEHLRKRLEQIESLEKKLAADQERQILLVRKTGDLQIELD